MIPSDTTPFPLWALLTIYSKAERECYIDYMAGFKALVDYLGPVVVTRKESPKDYSLLYNYPMQQMSIELGIPQDTIIDSYIYEVPHLISEASE